MRNFTKNSCNQKYKAESTRLRGYLGFHFIQDKGPGCASLYYGRINADRYIETLENHILPSATLFYGESVNFEFHGASPHSAKKTQAWFEEQGIEILQNPPRSPDLNPIENIWAWIDRHLTRIQITSFLDYLKELLEQEWAKVSRENCMSLVESMPNRVKKMLHGEWCPL